VRQAVGTYFRQFEFARLVLASTADVSSGGNRTPLLAVLAIPPLVVGAMRWLRRPRF
jgi:hypothetical protein